MRVKLVYSVAKGGGEGGEEDSPLPDLSNFNLPWTEKHAFFDAMLETSDLKCSSLRHFYLERQYHKDLNN